MFLSKSSSVYQRIQGKRVLLSFSNMVQRNMSIDVISTSNKKTFDDMPSLKDNELDYLNSTTKTNKSLTSQDHHPNINNPNQILSKIRSYEFNSKYTPQIIVAKYSKEAEEEDASLNDKQRYQLLHYIATLKTPYISIIDTTINGFNASTSILGGFKVVTEKARLQLDQVTFGTSFYLSRLDEHLSLYLLMTQPCLTGKELLFSGLATHYIHSSNIPKLETELQSLNVLDAPSVNQVLERFSDHLPNDELPFGGYHRTVIDRCFNHDSVEEILGALDTDGSSFALNAYHVISRDRARANDCLKQMRAARSSLGLIDHLSKETKDLSSFLNTHDFSVHPYNRYLMPFEREVRQYIEDKLFFASNSEFGEVVQYFVNARNGKHGVGEKVMDILERKTRRIQMGEVSKLVWCD